MTTTTSGIGTGIRMTAYVLAAACALAAAHPAAAQMFGFPPPSEPMSRAEYLQKLKYKYYCASDYQLRQEIAGQGYTNVYLGGDIGSTGEKEGRATMDGSVYLLIIHKCSGWVEERRFLRPADASGR